VRQIRDFEIFDTYLPPQISPKIPTYPPKTNFAKWRTNARMGLPTYPHRSAAPHYPTVGEKATQV
jgi:hypothetical protein